MKENLSTALSNSLSESTGNISANLAEVGLDMVVEEGLIRDIPLISTAISAYKIGKGIRELAYLKKMAAFVQAMNDGIPDEKCRALYKMRISADERKRNRELEYILVLIDRYMRPDKAKMLAKLYLAYLDERIVWDEFVKYAEVVDRLLPGDYEELQQKIWTDINDSFVSDNLLRLGASGLVVSREINNTDVKDHVLVFSAPTSKNYEITNFGIKLIECVGD